MSEVLDSLQRVPETELMAAPDHAAAYANADFSEPHSAFVEQFAQRFGEFQYGHVLDLGCGPADITIRFAQRYPGVHLTAVDGSEAMLDLARPRIEAVGLASRIAIEHAYLPDPALLKRPFDALISNSLLHHLRNPLAIWEAAAALPTGAPIWVVDLLRPSDEAMLEELVQCYAKGEHPLLVEDFANSLRAAYRPAEIAEQLAAVGLGHLNIAITSDRHLAIWGRR